MHELDHHPENESRYSCQVCEDSGVTKDDREYCSCRLGAARKNSDRFAEMLRGVPFTDAIWTATHATMKAERATAAVEKAVLNMQLNGYAKDSYTKDLRIAELERELAEVRKDAIPAGYALVPVEPTHKMVSAMACSKAIDDEGEFPILADLLDFSGENKTYTVVRAAYVAAIAAASVAQANKEQG
jgi:hypothetical protein